MLDYDYDDDVNGYGVDRGQLDDTSGYCKHGNYTGGYGIDFMCGYCEDGLDQWYPETYYRVCVVVRHDNDHSKYSSHTDYRQFCTIEEADTHADWWEENVGYTGNIVGLVVYSQQGGYWGEREREKEHHVEVWDQVREMGYGVHFRFDKELDHLREQIALINEHNGEERFFLYPATSAFDVHEVSRFMQDLVERNPDDYR